MGPFMTIAPKPPSAWYLNPYFHLGLNCALMAAAELLLKVGATEQSGIAAPEWLKGTGLTTLGSWWTIGGVVVYILAFVNWLYVLRWIALSRAYLVTSSVQVLIALGAWLMLGEAISLLRWGGIALITAGIVLSAQSSAQAEEKL
jgi:multidrug transporter EmrE-like cation transporter